MRNPKRTAATASALMIGVGLVGFITIFAASTKASFGETGLGASPATFGFFDVDPVAGSPDDLGADTIAIQVDEAGPRGAVRSRGRPPARPPDRPPCCRLS